MLTFAVGYQWLQVAMVVLHANVLGFPVESFLPATRSADAVWLSLGGLLALGTGIRLGMLRLAGPEKGDPRWEVAGARVQQLLGAYLALFLMALAGRGMVGTTGGLAQIVLAVFNLRWFFFALFAYAILARRRGYSLLALAVGLEVVVGFTGFFSGFKDIFFVFLVVYLMARPGFSLANVARVAGFVAALFFLGALWMSVRGEYRGVISGGDRAQAVRLGFVERSRVMVDMILDLDVNRFLQGVELLAERMSYVGYFDNVLFMVPRVIPHEHGTLWRAAVAHVLQPRLFFPNKPVLPSDSELTMKYTGQLLASEAEGASISLGYFAESYIDFGRTGMMVIIGLVGLGWGLIYRAFFTMRLPWSVASAAAIAVLINANEFEMHNVKLLGSILMAFLVTWGFLRFALPLAAPWLGLRGVLRRYLMVGRPVAPRAVP